MDTLKRVNKWELKGTSNLQHIINVARHNDSEVMIWDEELGTFTEIEIVNGYQNQLDEIPNAINWFDEMR